MPFGVMSGVGRGMVVLDEVVIVEGEGAVLGANLGRPIVTNIGDALFPNYFGEDLLISLMTISYISPSAAPVP